jgi:uncharacterized membrane protein (GlpM family)
MSVIVMLKLTLVPALIAGVTLAGRRWGPAVAGWLSAFPVVSGPILLIMTLEQGPDFTTAAAVGTLSAVLAILIFGIAYAWAATRHAWPISLITGLLAYAMAVAGLSHSTPRLSLFVPMVLAALMMAPRLYPESPASSVIKPAQARPANDIALRMLAGALLVMLVTHFAPLMGPSLSGVLAMFPVMASVLAVISHRHVNASFAIQMLRGMVLGYYAFAAFCSVLALALPTAGTTASFGFALAAAVSVQVISRHVMLRRSSPTLGRNP